MASYCMWWKVPLESSSSIMKVSDAEVSSSTSTCTIFPAIRCVEWITHHSPTASPYQSDEEDNDDADAAEGLLGMAAIGGLSTDTVEGNGVEGGVDEDDDEYGW